MNDNDIRAWFRAQRDAINLIAEFLEMEPINWVVLKASHKAPTLDKDTVMDDIGG